MLPTTNKPAQFVRTGLVDIVNAEVTAAESSLIAAQPWLGLPVVKQLWEKAFQYFVGQLTQGLAIFAGKVVVDAEEYFNLKKAAKALQDLNAAKASGDQNAINQASSHVDETVAPLLHYVGDTHG